ncbi:hypothetical protein AB0K48_43065 [Nonomuraea sp. NPDC055795]
MASPPTTEPPATLWKNRDFLKLWSGESLSLVGSQVTVLAMPIVSSGRWMVTTASSVPGR